jgi:hypothetical protein
VTDVTAGFLKVTIDMIRVCLSLATLIAVSAALLAGCGSGNPATYAVTGTVTYQGKPVEGAGVMFMPSSGRPASSMTDAQGRFTLRTFKDGDGAVEGENVVCISKMVPAQGDATKDPMFRKMISLLPQRYATPVTSPLKVNVRAQGPNEFNLELTDGLPSGK